MNEQELLEVVTTPSHYRAEAVGLAHRILKGRDSSN